MHERLWSRWLRQEAGQHAEPHSLLAARMCSLLSLHRCCRPATTEALHGGPQAGAKVCHCLPTRPKNIVKNNRKQSGRLNKSGAMSAHQCCIELLSPMFEKGGLCSFHFYYPPTGQSGEYFRWKEITCHLIGPDAELEASLTAQAFGVTVVCNMPWHPQHHWDPAAL